MRTGLIALLLAASAALPGAAAPKPQITDPAGDGVIPVTGMDIVSATFSTAGTTAKAGRRTVYTPTKLVVAVTFAGPVTVDQWATHEVTFQVPFCGEVYLELYGGGTYGAAECLDEKFAFPSHASGSTLTFTLPFATVGAQYFAPGTRLTKLVAYSAVGDPILGYESRELTTTVLPGVADGAVDSATTALAFTIR